MRRIISITPSVNAGVYGGFLIQLPILFSYLSEARVSLMARLGAEIKLLVPVVPRATTFSCSGNAAADNFSSIAIVRGALYISSLVRYARRGFWGSRLPEKQVDF